jgi:hypothetical protein
MSDLIIESVAAGAILSLFSWLLSLFVKKIVIPWIKNIRYDGFVIQGDWYCNYSRQRGSSIPDQRIEISQSGPKLSGEILINRWHDGASADVKLLLHGEVIGEKVFIRYRKKGAPSQLYGAVILEISEEVTRLDGWGITVDPFDQQPCYFERTWFKKK